MSGLRVERFNYSVNPWRVVDGDDREVVMLCAYPGRDDLPPFWAPLAFGTKREAVEALGVLAARSLELGRRVLTLLDALSSKDASAVGACVDELRAAARAAFELASGDVS